MKHPQLAGGSSPGVPGEEADHFVLAGVRSCSVLARSSEGGDECTLSVVLHSVAWIQRAIRIDVCLPYIHLTNAGGSFIVLACIRDPVGGTRPFQRIH